MSSSLNEPLAIERKFLNSLSESRAAPSAMLLGMLTAARDSDNEFRNFLSIARSSLSELDTQLDLSYDLGFVPVRLRSEVDELLSRVDRMLYALHRVKKH